MKVLLLTILAIGAVVAEPAFRRQQAQQQDGQDADEGYAPSGWKPSGQRLELPKQYGPPPKEEEADVTTETPTEEPAPAAPAAPKTPKSQKQQAAPQYQGEYYVVLPDGRLQRVQFAASVEQQQQQQQQQQEQQQATVPQQAQYFVVLPDGRLQEVEFAAKVQSEERKDGHDAADEEAADEEPAPAPARPNRPVPSRPSARPQSGQRRPQAEKVQRRPVVLMAQPQPQPQQQAVPASFVAELRYMEVPPITGPVFSYSGPLVRVQRQV